MSNKTSELKEVMADLTDYIKHIERRIAGIIDGKEKEFETKDPVKVNPLCDYVSKYDNSKVILTQVNTLIVGFSYGVGEKCYHIPHDVFLRDHKEFDEFEP